MVNDILDRGGNMSSIAQCPVCKEIADKKCAGCHNVSYCSAQHQKKHWKIHKNECRLFTVKRNETYGRFLVATRDIPQGAIIFKEEPLTFGPKRSTLPICLGCHVSVDGSYRCSKCTYPMCSEECEKTPIHAENECLIFQRATHPVGSKISNFGSICPAYECVTPLRCLLLRERNPSKWEKLITMEHHNELRKSVPGIWNTNAVNVVKLLLEWCKMKDELDDETVHSVLGYIDVNCFEIKYQNVEICGVYRDGGLMAHDCVPNTHSAISMSGDHIMIVRSSTPIKKGEMITTTYANQLSGTIKRRSFLRDTKYFDCFCKRCCDPSEFATYISGLKCTDCATGYLLPKDPLSTDNPEWICTNTADGRNDSESNNGSSLDGAGNASRVTHCTKSMKEDQIQAIVRKASKDIDEVSRSTAGSPVSRLERLLKKYSGKVLHPNHYLLLDVIRNLNYSYSKQYTSLLENEDPNSQNLKDEMELVHLTRAKSLCLQLLSVLDMIDPGLTRLRGVTLYQLALAEYHIARSKYLKKEMSKVEYGESIQKILVYLETSKDILELDKLVTPNALVFHEVNGKFNFLQSVLAYVGQSSN